MPKIKFGSARPYNNEEEHKLLEPGQLKILCQAGGKMQQSIGLMTAEIQ